MKRQTPHPIILHKQRIIEFRLLRTAITANMGDVTEQMLTDLLEAYTLRQVARRIGRSPTYLSHVKNGHAECSHEVFLMLFDLWDKLHSFDS